MHVALQPVPGHDAVGQVAYNGDWGNVSNVSDWTFLCKA